MEEALKVIVLLMLLVFMCSCATSSKSNVYIKSPVPTSCWKVAKLSATAFSVIPPVASSLAKMMLENKAKEFEADKILVEKEEGIFNVNIQASGYNCM